MVALSGLVEILCKLGDTGDDGYDCTDSPEDLHGLDGRRWRIRGDVVPELGSCDSSGMSMKVKSASFHRLSLVAFGWHGWIEGREGLVHDLLSQQFLLISIAPKSKP